MAILKFTKILLNNSISPFIYNSYDHLSDLLNSTDLNIVVAVLDLLHAINEECYLNLVSQELKPNELCSRLKYLAESWGGKAYGVSLAECAQDLPSYPQSATTLHFEFNHVATVASDPSTPTEKTTIRIENVHEIDKPLSEQMNDLVKEYNVPPEYQQQMYTRLRLTKKFRLYQDRKLCVYAHLCSISINGIFQFYFI